MTEYILQRYADRSGVSGIGTVADIYEAPDGAVAIRWRGEHPAWGIWPDIRDLEAIHGHGGDSIVQYLEKDRLLSAYQRTITWLLSARYADRPITVMPHPDHPDRLRLTFKDERVWRFWISLFDGSSHAAVHEEVAGEIEHRWVTPDGDLWLIYHSPISNPGTAWDRHDDPEVNR